MEENKVKNVINIIKGMYVHICHQSIFCKSYNSPPIK